MRASERSIRRVIDSTSLGAPENAVGFVLWRVVVRYQREVDRALVALDLTHLQFETLILSAWLARDGEAVTQAALARFGDIHPMQISHMLKTLESKGMIGRQRSASDARAKHIVITPHGLQALRRSLPVVIAVQRRMFGDEGLPGGRFLATLLRIDNNR